MLEGSYGGESNRTQQLPFRGSASEHLLEGMRAKEAKKLAETLNEHVLDMFVTISEKPGEA